MIHNGGINEDWYYWFWQMGSAIGARLLHESRIDCLVARSTQSEASKIAAYASTKAGLDQSDIIISILANDEATERAYFGAGGIAKRGWMAK